ncbi:DUF983 domain-containing protein [Postechiella marina]|uniref:DUF983 domain-containing protein n=1 Tax=Postechiella marina TaxID=943941 RepID=A0ABP8CHK8_9FLAO
MRIISLLKGKCPQCEKKDIFKSNGNLLKLQIPEMNNTCKNCNFKFEKEPGFFFGAMFVSYAVTAAEFIAVFIVSHFILGLSLLTSFFMVIIIAIILSGYNFRLSRSIWIYLFAKPKVKA